MASVGLNRLLLTFVPIALLFYQTSISHAGDNQWTSLGLQGENVKVLVFDPSTPTTIYAGTGNGVFKTIDGGQNWSASSSGLVAPDIAAMAISDCCPSVVYAGNLYISADGGENWTSVYEGLNGGVLSLAVAPNTASTAYAGTDRGVYKTEDSGGAWTEVLTVYGGVIALAIDPGDPETVYAATFGGGEGVLKTIDGGANWSVVNEGLTNGGVTHTDLTDLRIDPSSPSTLYVSAPGTGGVFKTIDGGANWTPLTDGSTTLNVYALAIAPANTSVLYRAQQFNGVFQSTDGGVSWGARLGGPTGPSPHINAITVDPDDPNEVYVGTEDGVLHYRISPSDGGGGGGGGCFFQGLNWQAN